MLKSFVCITFLIATIGNAYAASPVIAWTSDTSYIVFDGTAQANIIGSGTVASGSTQIAYGKPQIEMSALVEGKAIANGVAATNPSIGKTITAISGALAADVATGSTCSGGGVWGVIGCTVLSAITQTAVFLGVDKLWNWLFGSNAVTYTPSSTSFQGTGEVWAAQVWVSVSGSSPTTQYQCSPDINALAQAYQNGLNNVYEPYASTGFGDYVVTGKVSGSGTSATATLTGTRVFLQNGAVSAITSVALNLTPLNSGLCGLIVPPLTSSTPVTTSVSSAVNALPLTELSGAADPDTTAEMVDAAWRQAASQAGYQGVPYPSTNPIAGIDVSTWESDNPGFAPTLGDDLGDGTGIGDQGNGATGATMGALPQSGLASDGTGPSSSTGTSTGTSGTTTGTGTTGTTTGASGTTGTSTSYDLCSADPSASACASLGNPPTTAAFPASSVAVSISPWSIGPNSGTCPQPITVTVFGSVLSFSYTPLCTFAGEIQPLVLALCGLLAALIVIGGVKS